MIIKLGENIENISNMTNVVNGQGRAVTYLLPMGRNSIDMKSLLQAIIIT